MEQAVRLAPNNVAVLIPRGATLTTSSKDYVVDNTISELEQKLAPAQFIRIHRATLLNVNYIEETSSWFGGGMVVRLKDGKHTELQVARDRVRELRSRLDF